MINPELIYSLIQKDCSISADQILCGHLDKMLVRGLRVLTLCFDGSGRSKIVADTLTKELGIPAVRLIKGLSQFEDRWNYLPSVPHIQTIINTCPTVAIILTSEEIKHHHAFISNLRALKYPNSTSAINSLKIMETGDKYQ